MDPHFPSTVAGDVYGLGKVLYVAMTGLNPGRFPDLPTDEALSPEQHEMDSLLQILVKACTPNKEQRYASVAAMRADLEELRSLMHAKERDVG